MLLLSIILTVIYGLALSFILMYSLVQLHLVYHYVRHRLRRTRGGEESSANAADLPFVTVQLPIYNELYVVERLIDAVAAFDYPWDRLEIQVLDDSTDETVEIIERKVAEKAAAGLNILHIRRDNRKGFKAGALAEGLKTAKGEFIAIFDADFLPHKDFLYKTLPYFRSPKLGLVQTRWLHINEQYSLLTRLQAFALDAHFSVEQMGRNAGGFFMNFNGTAGVWRRSCIEDAGGWQPDTLTEDLDLSYRAQLRGWQFRFLEDQESPSELPVAMSAIKSQQFRWTKGAAEVARKNLWSVIKARLPFRIKLHATFHLLNSMLFICILLSGLLSVPLLFLRQAHPELNVVFKYGSIFFFSLFALLLFFFVARNSRETGNFTQRTGKFFLKFPVFLALSMGMSLHNAVATLEGYLGFKSPFIRTPKFDITELKQDWRKKNKYLTRRLPVLTWFEGLFALYFLGGLIYAIILHDTGMIPYFFMLTLGFSGIFYYSVRHAIIWE